MTTIWHWLLVAVIVLVMGGGGAAHLTRPELFYGFVFEPLPKLPVVLATGVLQIVIAVAALVPSTRRLAGLAFAALCTAYLPLHIWDLVRPDPVIAPLGAAVFRIVIQLGFIWIGVRLWRTT